MASTADEIERQADRAIYRDDPDAIDRLTEKIARLEASREAMKRANAIVRNKGLTDDEKRAQIAAATGLRPEKAAALLKPDYCGRLGFPSYALSNLGGTITKERKRLADLTAAKTPSGTGVVAPTAATATARAGLTITATRTTPAKAWKKPRPVWNVSGNLAFWRPLLVEQLGGRWYHGIVSFWDDPSEGIEQAVQEAEARDRARGIALEVPG